MVCSSKFRDASWVLEEQIVETRDEDVFHSSPKGQSVTPIMIADIGIKACPAVER